MSCSGAFFERAVQALACVLVAIILCGASGLAAQREFTYSVASRGSVHADMNVFAQKVAAVYADPRGWSLAGALRFREVARGGDFTVWLATPDKMSSFGVECTSQWDCRSERDVIINEARWQTGSPYWPGVLDDYRSMILNHESGHWLGLDHATCERAGALAPVMMQQSKGVGVCRPNPWPLASERRAVTRSLHLTAQL